MRFCQIWRRFWRHNEGSSLLEFAFAAPIIILVVAAIIDFMMVIFVTSLLEGGLQSASRFGRTGAVPSGMTREAMIQQLIADATIGLVDINLVTIETKVYPCFDAIGQPEPFIDNNPTNGSYDVGEPYTDVNGNGAWDSDMASAGLGNPGEVVRYDLRYDWAALTPLIGEFFGPDGKIPLAVSVAVRNEPFSFSLPLVTGPAGPGTTGC